MITFASSPDSMNMKPDGIPLLSTLPNSLESAVWSFTVSSVGSAVFGVSAAFLARSRNQLLSIVRPGESVEFWSEARWKAWTSRKRPAVILKCFIFLSALL